MEEVAERRWNAAVDQMHRLERFRAVIMGSNQTKIHGGRALVAQEVIERSRQGVEVTARIRPSTQKLFRCGVMRCPRGNAAITCRRLPDAALCDTKVEQDDPPTFVELDILGLDITVDHWDR